MNKKEGVDKVEEQSNKEVPKQNQQPEEKEKKLNLDDLEEFRKYKSARDRREAMLSKELEDQKRRLEQLQEQMFSLVDDPEAKAALREKALQAELERYKRLETLNKTKALFAERWGVPEGALATATTESEMTALALDYLKSQAEAKAKAEREDVKKAVDTEDKVSTSPGTTPDSTKQSVDDIDKQIEEWREKARKGGGSKARVEILKLKARKNRTLPPSRSRV